MSRVSRSFARVRLWLRRGKGCRSCCLCCPYYHQCAEEQKSAAR